MQYDLSSKNLSLTREESYGNRKEEKQAKFCDSSTSGILRNSKERQSLITCANEGWSQTNMNMPKLNKDII